jgi:hypothetical protein
MVNHGVRQHDVKPGIQIAGSVVAAIATFLCVAWLEFLIAIRFQWWTGYFGWVRPLLPFVCAAVVVRYTWPTAASVPGVLSVLVGAAVTGGIGFAIGFFGPMILEPSSPQGPLLGIFVTGPLGLLAGAVGGAVFWLKRLKI